MVANLLENVKDALDGLPVASTIAWIDSKVALHWIRGEGTYKQFINNRVKKIRSTEFMTWKHVPGEQNPADIEAVAAQQQNYNSKKSGGKALLGFFMKVSGQGILPQYPQSKARQKQGRSKKI